MQRKIKLNINSDKSASRARYRRGNLIIHLTLSLQSPQIPRNHRNHQSHRTLQSHQSHLNRNYLVELELNYRFVGKNFKPI
ncbi:hypothetical protein RCL_jg7209.t1 [Rhizophagus clarus]|uniref:Uncharacterized protein n=1 Tax=Rhizophagus clarus TaxID=94130 RepID=A0A8H3LYH8_9GLOM|nr:hypothetical protein RCL_jg7209.t1 [Rhizophagus clarus]